MDAVWSVLVPAGVSAAVSVTTTALGTRGAVRERRSGEVRADVHAAQDALRALRDAYRRVRDGDGATTDREVAGLEDTLAFAAQRTLSNAVIAAAETYLLVGREDALRDDVLDAAEDVAFEALSGALLAHLRANR